ncbi:DUF4330 domain-containing protein [Halorussus aquaticus]|uniref:DUF4330 domain-containing protein n=1 Tax=Halorussus aquaticus TaxID=2953748 RepID=A0ABD5Q5U1_9EURY|nr:DUF4330 domain-containing protein [Halorussus aquaticus]
MDLIDDKGRFFGTVNIIDALAVLFVLAVVAAGTTFVLGADDQPTNAPEALTDNSTNTTTIVTLEITGIQPYVADAIPKGPIDTDRITAVENKSVRPTEVVVTAQDGTLHEQQHPRKQTVTLRVSLNTTTTEDDLTFGDKPLEVGRQLTLDFGQVTVEGTVTGIANEN